jgi:hypothetical protein
MDDRFRSLSPADFVEQTQFSPDHLANLAIVALFSVFEALVREKVLNELAPEARANRHRTPRLAVLETRRGVSQGSFAKVLKPFKDIHAGLVEEVNQVRRYRNWVAHGRKSARPDTVDPMAA